MTGIIVFIVKLCLFQQLKYAERDKFSDFLVKMSVLAKIRGRKTLGKAVDCSEAANNSRQIPFARLSKGCK